MEVYSIKVSSVVAVLGTWFTFLVGEWNIPLAILVVCIGFDYITGVVNAYFNKVINSQVGLIGIARKLLIFVVLIIAVMLDRLLESETFMFRTLVTYFYIANEGISILENCSKMGVKIPKQLKEALEQVRKDKGE